jgi:hypothetical protein
LVEHPSLFELQTIEKPLVMADAKLKLVLQVLESGFLFAFLLARNERCSISRRS